MEPYTCCDAPSSCSSTGKSAASMSEHSWSLPQRVHIYRKELLSQLEASPLHAHVLTALSDHPSFDMLPRKQREECADFASAMLHVVFLMAECDAIALPAKFHVDMSRLGLLLKPELDGLHKQLKAALRR